MSRRFGHRAPRRKNAHAQRLREYHLWKISLLEEFLREHTWRELRKHTVVPPGVKLSDWVQTRRRDYKTGRIPGWLVARCERIPGWSWDPWADRHRRMLDELRRFARKHGLPRLPMSPLGEWARTRRQTYRAGKIEPWLARALAVIPGWSWDPRTAGHARKLNLLRAEVRKHGWDRLRTRTGARDSLGKWVSHMLQMHRKGRLPPWLVRQLEAVPGWEWSPAVARQRAHLQRFLAWIERHGWSALRAATTIDGWPAGLWYSGRMTAHRRGRLPRWMVARFAATPGWDPAPRPTHHESRPGRRARRSRR